MKKINLTVTAMFVLVGILAAIGTSPRYLEEVAVGGGYGDSTDGGADFEKNGDILTNGDLTVEGGIASNGDLTVDGNAIVGNGDIDGHSVSIFAEINGDSHLNLHEVDVLNGGSLWYDGSANKLCLGTRNGSSTVTNAIEITRADNSVQIENLSVDSSFSIDGDYQGISSENVIALWHCEGDGKLLDWSGNGITGTCSASGIVETSGKYGTGLEFTGTGYVSTSNIIPNGYGTSDLSISVWVKTAVTGSLMAACGWYGGSSGQYCSMQLDSSGKPQFRIQDAGGAHDLIVSSSSSVANNGWHHLVGVRDYGNNVSLYVDGILAAAKNDTAGDISDSVNLYIGSLGTTFRCFNGSIDEVIMWDKALSAEEVKILYMQNQEFVDLMGNTVIGGTLSLGLNSNSRGAITIWDGAGGNTPGYLKIGSPNGTMWYFFVDDSGNLRVHNSVPSQNSDGTGV